MLLTQHLKPSALLPCDIKRWWLLTFLHSSACSFWKDTPLHSLKGALFLSYHCSPWPSCVYPASRPGSALDSPLLCTLKPLPWSRPQHQFLEHSGSCFLVFCPQSQLLESSSHTAQRGFFWKCKSNDFLATKIFCHFISRIKFQVSRRNDSLLRFPSAASRRSSSFSFTGLPAVRASPCCCFYLECSSLRAPLSISLSDVAASSAPKTRLDPCTVHFQNIFNNTYHI